MKKTWLLILFSWVLISCNKTDEIAVLRVTPTDPIEFSAEATETFVLTVNSTNCDWVATSSQPWCRVTKFNNKITISAFANDQTTAPTPATVTFEAPNTEPVVVHVTQLGSGSGKREGSVLTVTPTDPIQFSAEATETFVLNVTTTATVWDALSDQSWCRVSQTGSKIVVTALPNTLSTSPTPATITVTAAGLTPVTIQVGQLGAGSGAPSLDVSPSNSVVFSSEATEVFDLAVATNQGPWDAISDQSWCKVSQTGTHIFIMALPNYTANELMATVTVTSGKATPVKIAVTQQPYAFVYMPDTFFRRTILSSYDTNYDSQLSFEEAAAITTLTNLSNKNIASLQGVEAFVNLKILAAGGNFIGQVDLSQNTLLEEVSLENNPLLTSLNLQGLSQLTHLYLRSTKLSQINLSESPELIELTMNYTPLATLDVSSHKKLTNLDVSNNQLTSLNVKGADALKTLYCSSNKLQTIDFSTNSALTYLDASRNELSGLDLTHLPNLDRLWISKNKIQTLDFSGNPKLYLIDANDNDLGPELDFTTNTALYQVGVYNNPRLTTLWLYTGQNLNISKSTQTVVQYK